MREDSSFPEDRSSEYLGWSEAQIAAELRATAGRLLVRGKATTLVARKHAGELLWVAAKQHRRQRAAFERFSLATVGLGYAEARKHIQLWVYWDRVEAVIDRIRRQAEREGKPAVILGYYKLLRLAGVIEDRRRPKQTPDDTGEEIELLDVEPDKIDDLAAAREIIFKLQGELRISRAQVAKLRVDLSITNQTVHALRDRLNQRERLRRQG